MREKILRILQKNSRLSNADIAAMTGLSEQEVADEIKDLEDRKIINGDQAIVNWENFDEDKVTAIIESAFSNTGIKTVTIPGSVYEIGEEAFSSCIFLSKIEIPDTLTVIGESAFERCSKKPYRHRWPWCLHWRDPRTCR